ncbi:MAG: AMIN domain-containing protein [Candidatus Aminicenantes bacterium]|nr:AMIN domain-containing protein [Candidatus Aminicenantes bacterium]
MRNGWISKVFSFCLISILCLSPILFAEEAELKSIRFTQKDDRLEVTAEISGEFGFETFSLIGPKRLVIDLSPIKSIKALPSISVNACGVIRIRCGQFKPEVARIVFDLAERIPSHKISRVPEGLRVLFWQEEQVPAAVVVPEVKEEAQVIEKKPAPVTPPAAILTRPQPEVAKKASFLRLQGSLSLFPTSLISTQKEMTVYGERGSLKEKYKANFNLAFGLSLARAIKIKEKEAKLGAEFATWFLSHKGSFVASVPHPFIPNTPRDFTFEEKLSNSLYQIGAFFLYPAIRKEKINLWLGPAIGYTFGKLTTLEDFYLEDRPPYSSADLFVTDTVLIEENVSDFIFELKLEFNYALSANTFFLVSTSISYFNPKVSNLGKRAKFLAIPFYLGLEFRL